MGENYVQAQDAMTRDEAMEQPEQPEQKACGEQEQAPAGRMYRGKDILAGSQPAHKQLRVMVYNFRRPDKFSKDQIRTLAMLHETFARLCTTSLSALLRCTCRLHVAGVDQCTYEEFRQPIKAPTPLGVINMQPMKCNSLFQLTNDFAFGMIERLTGSSQTGRQACDRDLTDIECALLEEVFLRMLGSLNEAWSTIVSLQSSLAQLETNPQFAQIVPPAEMIVLITFQYQLQNRPEGLLNLCLPYLTLEPLIDRLNAHYWYSLSGKQNKRTPALPGLGRLKTATSLFFEGETLSLHQLAGLKKGSLLKIPGLDQGRAYLAGGRETVLGFRTGTLKKGMPHTLTVDTGQQKQDQGADTWLLPTPVPGSDEQTSPETTSLTSLFGKFEAAVKQDYARLEKRLAEINAKQDELADQLYFNTTGGGAAAEQMAEQNGQKPAPKPFHFVQAISLEQFSAFMAGEHPQVIALILSYLDPLYAGMILARFPPGLQVDAALRLATIEQINPSIVAAIERVIRKKMTALQNPDSSPGGGIKGLVEILNASLRQVERTVINGLEKQDKALAEEVKNRLFVFEDITLLAPGDIGTIAGQVQRKDLLYALKGISAELQQQILQVLPPDEQRKLSSELAATGKIRQSDAEAAQQRVVAVIRELEEKGLVLVARPGELVE